MRFPYRYWHTNGSPKDSPFFASLAQAPGICSVGFLAAWDRDHRVFSAEIQFLFWTASVSYSPVGGADDE